jgi:hypothetical protein
MTELISDITQEVIELHRKYRAGEPGGVRLVTVAGKVKISTNLSGADLSWANMLGADLSGANMLRANLSDANLSNANLSGANLYGADLRHADLSDADLSDADLSNSDLRWANMLGANLHGADIDFSAWPLWCGSNHVKVDVRIAAQLAAHFCALDCDDPAYRAERAAVLDFAKTSHRAEDLGI